MTSGEAVAFFAQLSALEEKASLHGEELSELSKYVMIITDPVTQQVHLSPLGGIESNTVLWEKIQQLFASIVASEKV